MFVPFLALVVPLAVSAGPSPSGSPGVRRPSTSTNVLVVLVDDASQREYSLYGDTWPNARPVPAPHVERLAREGVTFHGVQSYPTCSPTRAALLTGRYGFRTTIGTIVKPFGDDDLPHAETTVAEVLEDAGIPTLCVGKWHVSSQGQTPGSEPIFLEPNLHGFGDYLAGSLNAGVDSYYGWSRTDNGSITFEREYATTAQVDACLQWIANTEPGWFAYLSFNASHTPFHEPPDELLPGDAPAEWTDRSRYVAALAALDAELGRLLEAIDLETTTMIFLADNGTPPTAAHPLQNPRKVKTTVFREGVEVPCVIAGAGVAPHRRGTQDHGLRSVVDVFAEVLAQLGVPAPAGTGTDALPLLSHPGRAIGFTEKFGPNGNGPYTKLQRALRDQRFKLIRRDSVDELYDLLEDPAEEDDLLMGRLTDVQSAAYQRLVEELVALTGSRAQ